jgi:hypothetical protein
MRKVKLICLAMILLFISGCFSTPKFYKISPQKQYVSHWLQGKEYVEIRQDSLEIVSVFQEIDDGKMIFSFKITNLKQSTFDVNPEKFYCTFDTPLQDTTRTVTALDPEVAIRRLKANIKQKKSSLKRQRDIDAFTNLLDAVLDANSKKTEKQKTDDKIADNTREIEQKLSYSEAERKIINLNKLHNSWNKDTLRRTTLSQNNSISGLVYFPFNSKAKNLTLYLPLETNIIDIVYQQKMMEMKKL